MLYFAIFRYQSNQRKLLGDIEIIILLIHIVRPLPEGGLFRFVRCQFLLLVLQHLKVFPQAYRLHHTFRELHHPDRSCSLIFMTHPNKAVLMNINYCGLHNPNESS